MLERYTENARRVSVSSKHKASHVGSREIDTEHLLLGLLSTDQELARRFLGSPWAADSVWRRIEQSGKIGEPIKGPHDLPLSGIGQRALSYAADEADQFSSKHIGTEHLLLGLLREQKCFAAEFLHEHGVRLDSAREELKRTPHKYSASDEFVREREPLPQDVVDQQKRVDAIFESVRDALAQRDLAKARQYSDVERAERKLRLLYQRYGSWTGSTNSAIRSRSQLA
jgi:ATP-dependent Clp protease ATP-binding subunit ClpC